FGLCSRPVASRPRRVIVRRSPTGYNCRGSREGRMRYPTRSVARIARLAGAALLAIGAATAMLSGAIGPYATNVGADPVSQTFDCTGAAQSFTVPPEITAITVDAFGAQGGAGNTESTSTSGGAGGLGGEARATIAVTPGETLDVFVGCRGGDGVGNDT